METKIGGPHADGTFWGPREVPQLQQQNLRHLLVQVAILGTGPKITPSWRAALGKSGLLEPELNNQSL